jgi:F-type H+-transporting ATPase subunit delta
MAAREEHDSGLARVYGASLLALAQERGVADELLGELQDLAQTVKGNAAFASFLSSPLVEMRAREKVLEKTLRGRASDLLVDAVQVLNRRSRVGLIPEVAAAYHAALRATRGEVDALVVTATPLSSAAREQLKGVLGKFTGKKPELIERVDPAVIGGLIVEVEGKKIDTSLATRLRTFTAALTRRADRGLGVAVESN